MPWLVDKNCVYKKNEDGSKGEKVGCSDSEEGAKRHLRALYANVKESPFAELSLAIVKASFETNEPDPNKRMRFRMSSSDTGKDLSGEAMSLDLFKNFTERIHNQTPIPEPFKSLVCENDWCGDMPYLSVAHYRAGDGNKNVPGAIEDVFVDGDILKSKGYLHDNPLGHAVFNSLLEDQTKRKSGVTDFDPVRISIGFLDLKHKHVLPDGGNEVIFERTNVNQICPLCEKGTGDKIYLDGILVHEAMTRVPMNPRTLMVAELEEKSMADEIKTKADDARSIIGDLADTLDNLEEKSILVVKTDLEAGLPAQPVATPDTNRPDPKYDECFDNNTGLYNQDCMDRVTAENSVGMRQSMDTVKSTVTELRRGYAQLKSLYKLNGLEWPDSVQPVMEAVMEPKDEKVVEKAMDEKEMEKHEEKMEDKEDEKKEKSALDLAYAHLKEVIAKSGTVEEIQAAYNEIGIQTEKTYLPKEAPKSAQPNFEEVLKAALLPLQTEIGMLKAQMAGTVQKSSVPQPRSLTVAGLSLKPADLIQKAQNPVAPKRTQLERIARASVYRGIGMQDPEQSA